jgi:hypothetical protein
LSTAAYAPDHAISPQRLTRRTLRWQTPAIWHPAEILVQQSDRFPEAAAPGQPQLADDQVQRLDPTDRDGAPADRAGFA